MGNVSIFLVLFTLYVVFDHAVSGTKEVLVRDRLVFLLCDQMAEYMDTGKFPPGVKVMPDKYKKIHPGAESGGGGVKGRSFGIKINKTGRSAGGKKKGRKMGKKARRTKREEGAFDFDPDHHFDVTVLDLFDE